MVGSGIQATQLTRDVGVQLLANSLATVFGLGVLIALFGPCRAPTSTRSSPPPPGSPAAAPATARPCGTWRRTCPPRPPARSAGAVLANAMFAQPLVTWSAHDRSAPHLWLGEVVATSGLILLIFGLARSQRPHFAPVAVASWIGSAYWFTSSTSFAKPAVTIGRAFTDSFAGIAPASLPAFVAAQLAGAVLGLVLVAVLFGRHSPVPATAPAGEHEFAATPGR